MVSPTVPNHHAGEGALTVVAVYPWAEAGIATTVEVRDVSGSTPDAQTIVVQLPELSAQLLGGAALATLMGLAALRRTRFTRTSRSSGTR